MKWLAMVIGWSLWPLLAGCTVSDALFAALGDHYTDGGYTRAEKQYHYNQQVEASRNAAASLP
jgi:hypothetical protein